MPKKDIEEESFDEKDEFIENVDEKGEPAEEVKQKMEQGTLEEDVYSEEGREEELEADQIEDWEQGFALGAERGGKGAKCRRCGKLLIKNVVEKRVKGELCFFCSDHCAEKYEAE